MGLFGPSPDEVQQQQDAQAQQQAFQLSQLNRPQQNSYNGALTGNMLGKGIQSLFGYQDPAVANAQKLQQVQQQTEQIAPWEVDPIAHMKTAIPLLLKAGLTTAASNAFDHLQTYMKANADAQKGQADLINAQRANDPVNKLIETGKYDPASVAAYKQSGNVSDLKLQENTSDTATIKEYNLAKYQGYTGTFQDFSKEQKQAGDHPFNQLIPTNQGYMVFDTRTGSLSPINGNSQVNPTTPAATPDTAQPSPDGVVHLIAPDEKTAQAWSKLLDSQGKPFNIDVGSAAPMENKPIKPMGSTRSLSDTAVDTLAFTTLLTGKNPTGLSRGYKGNTSADLAAVINRSGELQNELGLTKEQVFALQQNNKALTPALAQLQKQTQSTEAFEKTLVSNADAALQLSDKVWRTGSPWLNKPLMAIKTNGAGDPDVARLNVRTRSVMSEFAKIMSGSMGNQVLSDKAVGDAEQLINMSQTKEQFAAALNEIQAEAKDARIKNMKLQMNQMLQTMLPQSPSSTNTNLNTSQVPPPATGKLVYDPATGTFK